MVSGASISGGLSHTASRRTGHARPGKGAAAEAATTSTSAYRMDSGSTVARHPVGLEIQGGVAPSSQPAASVSNMIKKGRRAVGPGNCGFRPFCMKVLDMVEYKNRTTYTKVPKHKRMAADCDHVDYEEMEGTGNCTVKQRKKMKTTNLSEAHTDQRIHKRKHTHYDAKELGEQSTKKMKKSTKKTEAHQSTKNDALEDNTSFSEASHGCNCHGGISVKSPRDTSFETKNVEEGTSGPRSHSKAKELSEQCTKKRMGMKKKDKNSSKKKAHSDLLVLGKVSISYTGKQQDGTVFGYTTQWPLVFKLGDGEVIEGVDAGVVGMRVGERRKLTIPPSLGFGNKKMDNIPVNSTLEIDLELVRVVD